MHAQSSRWKKKKRKKFYSKYVHVAEHALAVNIFFNQSPFKMNRKCTKHVSKFLKLFRPSEISNLVKNVPIYS